MKIGLSELDVHLGAFPLLFDFSLLMRKIWYSKNCREQFSWNQSLIALKKILTALWRPLGEKFLIKSAHILPECSSLEDHYTLTSEAPKNVNILETRPWDKNNQITPWVGL